MGQEGLGVPRVPGENDVLDGAGPAPTWPAASEASLSHWALWALSQVQTPPPSTDTLALALS